MGTKDVLVPQRVRRCYVRIAMGGTRMKFLDETFSLFEYEPSDDFTKRAMAEFMKERYPGNYEVEVSFKDKGFTMTLKFEDPAEQTMFFLRYA